MRPHGLPVGHLVQLGDAYPVFIRWDMLRHNIHGHLTEKEVGADPRRGRDACCLNDIQYDLHGKVMGRQLVGIQVVGHIHEYLVDGVDHDVLRGDVFQVDLVDLCAVFHVVGHAGRGDDEVDFQLRVLLQLRDEV